MHADTRDELNDRTRHARDEIGRNKLVWVYSASWDAGQRTTPAYRPPLLRKEGSFLETDGFGRSKAEIKTDVTFVGIVDLFFRGEG
jgi:hypothetical protein